MNLKVLVRPLIRKVSYNTIWRNTIEIAIPILM